MTLLNKLTQHVQSELSAVEERLQALKKHENGLIAEVLSYVFSNSGKRLRPLLTLLSARLCDVPINEKIISLSTASEIIHTATLLHDDVVDNAQVRHGQPSVAQQWDNKTAILIGDFLYSKAFELLIQTHSFATLSLFARTTHSMAAGEVEQLNNRYNLDLTQTNYFKIIANKTGALFAAAACSPAILHQKSQSIQDALTAFGLNTGIAFQLIDDIFDYEKKDSVLGKPSGQDLSTGQLTLPAIIALKNIDPTIKKILHQSLAQQHYRQATDQLSNLIKTSNSISQTKEIAHTYLNKARKAIQLFPSNNPYQQELMKLTDYVMDRIY